VQKKKISKGLDNMLIHIVLVQKFTQHRFRRKKECDNKSNNNVMLNYTRISKGHNPTWKRKKNCRS